MKIGQAFNQLKLKEYQHYIDNAKKYTDFNTLGLYRSILENEKLSLAEKIEVREYAHHRFQKTFDFLQLKDPQTYFKVSTLGQSLTPGDEAQFWKEVIANQEKILKDKKIKHRSFGVYSKHDCGYDQCPYKGLMVKPDSFLKFTHMDFKGDKDKNSAKAKSKLKKSEQKRSRQEIKRISEEDDGDISS